MRSGIDQLHSELNTNLGNGYDWEDRKRPIQNKVRWRKIANESKWNETNKNAGRIGSSVLQRGHHIYMSSYIYHADVLFCSQIHRLLTKFDKHWFKRKAWKFYISTCAFKDTSYIENGDEVRSSLVIDNKPSLYSSTEKYTMYWSSLPSVCVSIPSVTWPEWRKRRKMVTWLTKDFWIFHLGSGMVRFLLT